MIGDFSVDADAMQTASCACTDCTEAGTAANKDAADAAVASALGERVASMAGGGFRAPDLSGDSGFTLLAATLVPSAPATGAGGRGDGGDDDDDGSSTGLIAAVVLLVLAGALAAAYFAKAGPFAPKEAKGGASMYAGDGATTSGPS